MTASGSASKPAKGQVRLAGILERIPVAREQLLVAIEDLGPAFDVAAIKAAATSADPRERNKVAVIERELDVLIAYMEELASRGLAEGKRLGVVPVEGGHPFERLADLGVIADASARRLQDVKDLRNKLAHAYPPGPWRALHQAVEVLRDELDGYTVKVGLWLRDTGILPVGESR
ncbi:MAG TPA: hypothetical protein VGV69_07450 [Solirubrobacterales bacterium]|nr:hypothetical protein [Solirubrobacterales bacterium]